MSDFFSNWARRWSLLNSTFFMKVRVTLTVSQGHRGVEKQNCKHQVSGEFQDWFWWNWDSVRWIKYLFNFVRLIFEKETLTYLISCKKTLCTKLSFDNNVPVSVKLNMIMDTNQLCNLIPALLTLIFMDGHYCLRVKTFAYMFLQNSQSVCNEVLSEVGTCCWCWKLFHFYATQFTGDGSF